MAYILADGWVVTMNERRDVLEADYYRGRPHHRHRRARRPDRRQSRRGGDRLPGSIVIPGFVNTHTHLFQTLLKGLGDDMVLKKWFTCMIGPSAVELTTEDVGAAAMHGCVESIRWASHRWSISCMRIHDPA